MSRFIDTGALDDCANGTASYGEICVGCNCCGRFDEDKGISLTEDEKQNRINAWWKEMEDEDESTAQLTCPVCANEEINPEDNFCKICGKKLDKSARMIISESELSKMTDKQKTFIQAAMDSFDAENNERQKFISQIPKELSKNDKCRLIALYDKFKEEET